MKQVIADLLGKKLKLNKIEIENLIEIPPNLGMGDYSFHCFVLSKKLKRSPTEIAIQLAGDLNKKVMKGIEKVEAKGAYVNFFVDKVDLAESVIKLALKDSFGKPNIVKKQKVLIDFSGPNIGKPMHIGHIRSTIIGDSILRIYDFLGYKVIGINYLGDVGLHIGKLIVAYELWLNKEELEKDPVKELLRLYVKFCDNEKTEYQEGLEEEFQDNGWTLKAKEKLKLLEIGDIKTEKIWKDILKHSQKGFNRIYDMLNVEFHETTGQSLFSEKGKQIITSALEKSLAKIDKDGAVYVELNDFGLPKKYVLRNNGTASYITQDIGSAVERYKKYNPDKIIYITDFRQELHFKQLSAILKKFGYNFSDKIVHVGFGTVNFGNEIMATRKGKIILLEDVLKKTVEKAEYEINKRKTKGNKENIGVGAIKFAFLKNDPIKDVNFSWEQALNFEGESGPYIQYSYARASSILRKARSKKMISKIKIPKLNNQEILLIKKILEFPDIVKSAGDKLNPSLISNYSFQLAQIFNEFYHTCPVINSENEDFRLRLIGSFRSTIRKSLYLLGIEVMEEM